MPLTQAKRVVRSDLWLNPVFDARLAQEQDISLGVFPVRGNPAAAWDMLTASTSPSGQRVRTRRRSGSRPTAALCT